MSDSIEGFANVALMSDSIERSAIAAKDCSNILPFNQSLTEDVI